MTMCGAIRLVSSVLIYFLLLADAQLINVDDKLKSIDAETTSIGPTVVGLASSERNFEAILAADIWEQSDASEAAWSAIASDYSGQHLVAAVEGTGEIYTSTDYGSTWELKFTLEGEVYWRGLASDASGQNLVAVQNPGDVYTSSNWGEAWAASTNTSYAWLDVASDESGQRIIACTADSGDIRGAVYLSNDFGATFIKSSAPVVGTYKYVTSDSLGKSLVAVAFSRGIYTSSNYGVNWIPTSAPSLIWGGIASDSTGTYLVAVCNQGIYTSNSTGRVWYLSSAPAQEYNSVACDSTGRYIDTTVYNGGIYSSADYGMTWFPSNPAVRNWIGIASDKSGKRLAAAATNEGIWTYLDSTTFAPSIQATAAPTIAPTPASNFSTPRPTSNTGTPWVQQSAPTGLLWISVSSDLTGQYLVAAEQTKGGLYTSINAGRNWTLQFTIPGSAQWTRVASNADGTRLVATANGARIYTSNNSGLNWTISSSPVERWFGVCSDYSGQYLTSFVNGGGGMHTSSDYGQHWILTDAPSAQWIDVTSDSTGQYIVGAVFGDVIYRSTDYGVTWMQTNSPKASWYGVASDASGRYLAAVVSSGNIFTSTDYGLNWVKTSAPVSFWDSVTSDATGSYLAACMNEGQIYVSNDFGATWTLCNAPTRYWESIASDAGGKNLVAVGSGVAGIWTYQDLTTFKPSTMPTFAPTRPTAQPTEVPSAAPTVSPTTLAPRPNPTARPTATPSQVPTRSPTSAPSAPPTASPTAVPTGIPGQPTETPTVAPTLTPTGPPSPPPSAVPTLSPSAPPSGTPTAPPTATPTENPSANPTVAPTAPPTATPTVSPSVDPTVSPSQEPSPAPTVQPSAAPTALVTRSPTAVPTQTVDIYVNFASNLTIAGCTSTDLDAASQDAIVSATAAILVVDESAVRFVGTAPSADAARVDSAGRQRSHRVRGMPKSLVLGGRQISSEGALAATHTVVAIVATSVLLSDTNFPSPTSLYDNLTMKLAQAVSSGRYDDALQQSVAETGSTQLTAATATAVASSPLVVTTEPVDSSGGGGGGGSSLSTYTIIGVALILFLGVCIISGCLYWHCVWSKRFRGPRSNMSRTLDIAEGNLVKKKPSFRNRLFKSLSKTRSGFTKLGTEGAATGEVEFQENPTQSAAERFQQTKEKSTFFEDAVWDLDEDAEEGEGDDGGMGMHDVQL
jgi:photosystem II stability/assembly factor-like uncharacterized protein